MFDDSKSLSPSSAGRRRTPKAATRRIYVVVNPNDDGDADGFKQPPYVPPPLPNPQARLDGERANFGPPHPGPINTDNLRTRYHPHYNTSDRTLSSPSTPTSSPAVESTPPPSTPGQKSVPSIDLAQGSDRSEPSQQCPGRAENIVRKITAPFTHARRRSSGHNVAMNSPINHDHYPPPPPPSSSAKPSSTPVNQVQILVTAESEEYKKVEITGARDPAFIKERIFSKLRISDDDQAHFSIYKTEVGAFALSDALTDDQLFALCQAHGDHKGTLKFLVSYTSATVHESPQDLPQSQTVNCIPPPVLPQSSGIYSPVRTKRRSRSPQRSLSSTSERHPQEGGTSYDASVSDDLDNAERDPNRTTIRPIPYKSNALSSLSQTPIPPSLRPHSPPSLPQDRSRIVPPEVAPLRLEKSHASPAPPPPVSPNNTRLPGAEDAHCWKSTLVPTSDAAAERERALEQAENKVEIADQQWRLQEEKRRRDGQQRRVHDSQKPKGRGEHWTVVPSDIPHSDYKKERPSTVNETHRSPPIWRAPGYDHQGFGSGRNPSAETKRRGQVGQPVPFHWAVAWRAPGGKADSKISPTLTSPLYRGIKSMENLRAPAKHPVPLQPGKVLRPPLPMSRPATSGASGPVDGSDLSVNSLPPIPRPHEARNNMISPVSGQSRPLPTTNFPSTSSSTSLGFTSPRNDSHTRPRSALGDSATSPHTTKALPIPSSRSDAESVQHNATGRSPPSARSPQQFGYPSSSRSAYGYDGSSNIIPRIIHSAQSSDERAMDLIFERGVTNVANRTPPSPVSPSSPRYSASSEPSPAETSRRLNSPLESNTEATLKGGRYPWMGTFLDGQSTDSTIIARKERPDIKPLPPHPVSRHLQGHPHSPPPPLPIPPSISPSTEPSTQLSSHTSAPTPVASVASSTTSVPAATASNPADDSDSGSNDGGTLWAIGNDINDMGTWQQLPADKRRSMRGPQLTVQIESKNSTGSTLPRPPDFPPPEYLPRRMPKGSKTPTGSSGTLGRHPNRTSVFNEDFRPPPEEVYERLGDFFPEHDLDEPVIEASSGGTSPTSADHPATPPFAHALDKRKHKKSIRVVANEHKRKLDRSSRASPANMANNVLRKRSTKLWGSKLEEVTAEQVRSGLSGSTPGPPGPKPIFKWVRGELIGRGTYGKVYVALNATTGEMIAVKQVEIPRTESDRNDTRQITVVEALKLESETLKDLDHPHVVQYLGFEETPKFLSIFLEYVPGGSVASCLRQHGRFDENVTKSFTGQILDGLEYLHSKGVLHRDLKADNILVESFGLCKISDFGISKRTDDVNMIGAYTSMQGSVFWMAPEVINTQKRGYNSKIDIWSVGCVVFEMWTGQRPWSGQEMVAVLLQLYQSKVGPPVPADVPLCPSADDFRKRCFQMNPDDRPTAAELRQHPYLILPPGWEFTDFV